MTSSSGYQGVPLPSTAPTSQSGTQVTPSTSNTSPTTESESQDVLPVEKIYIELDHLGNVIGPPANAKQWTKLAGQYVRGKIPIHVKDWRQVNSTFKNAVWNMLMEQFYFNIPEVAAREYMEVKFAELWRTHKSSLRASYIRTSETVEIALVKVPPKIDPIHWWAFVLDEFTPEKIARNKQNAKNRSQSKYSHTLGRCSYARKLNEMDKANPGKQHTRDEVWVAAHVRTDGTILPSAIEPYEKVKAVQEQRQTSGDDTYVHIDSDILTEALGADKKQTRVLNNHMFIRQYKRAHIAKLVYEKPPAKDEEVSELKNTLANVQIQNQEIMKCLQQILKDQIPSVPPPTNVSTTPSDAVGSNSIHRVAPQNLMNMFNSVIPPSRPKVELLSREGSIVAKRWVAMDIPSKICHGKTILASEKKVYVEEVIVAEAPIYERPQDGMMTMQEISEGGFLIWPDVLLRY